jgi:hypothetical protein
VPPIATFDENVVVEIVRVVPTALNIPPPNAEPAEPPEPPAPPVPDCPSVPAMLPVPWPPAASLAAVAADRLVRCDCALVDAQRPCLIGNTAAKRSSAATTAATVEPDGCSARTEDTVNPCSSGGDVIRHNDRSEFHIATRVQKAASLVGTAMLDCHARDLHLSVQDLKDSVKVVPVDDC